MPSRLITATPSCTASPMPGVCGERFAGRSTRSVPERYGAKPGWPQVQFPSVIDVGAAREQLVRELRGDAAARGGVLAVDDAEVGAELLAQRRQPRLDRPAAGRAEHVGDEEDASAASSPATSVAAGMNLDDDVVPRVVRVARERLALGVREVDDRAELRAGGGDRSSRRRATGRRARARPRRRATARRSAGCRCASRRRGRSATTSPIATTVPSTGE